MEKSIVPYLEDGLFVKIDIRFQGQRHKAKIDLQ